MNLQLYVASQMAPLTVGVFNRCIQDMTKAETQEQAQEIAAKANDTAQQMMVYLANGLIEKCGLAPDMPVAILPGMWEPEKEEPRILPFNQMPT